MKYIYYIIQVYLFVFLFSCCNTPKRYAHSTISIPPINTFTSENPADSDAFEISEVIHLELPGGVADVQGTPLFCNGRIYMYDVSREYVLAFDSIGSFLYKVGGLGHARNEIVGSIRNFDVDRHTNYIHIYNGDGRKVLVFDDKGKFVKSIMLHDCFPSYVVIGENGSYIASLDCASTKDQHTKLVVLDDKGKISKVLLEGKDINEISCEGVNTRPLFSDHKGNVAYLSILADSIIYVSEDTIRSVINLDFADGFLSDTEIKEAKRMGEISNDYRSIQYVSSCCITDDFLLMEYYGKGPNGYTTNYNYLINRKTNKDYAFLGYVNVPGMLSNVSNIVDDVLICVITEEDVLRQINIYDLNKKNESYHKTFEEFVNDMGYNAFCQELLTLKQETPVILKIKLK